MVYRVFVEKKEGLQNEARALLGEAKNLLGIEGIEQVRLFKVQIHPLLHVGHSQDLVDIVVQAVVDPFLDSRLGSDERSGESSVSDVFLKLLYLGLEFPECSCLDIVPDAVFPCKHCTAFIFVISDLLFSLHLRAPFHTQNVFGVILSIK